MGNEWKDKTLGEFVTLQRGHDLPEGKRTIGKVPILGSFGITGWHNESKATGPGVTIGRSGGSIGVVSYSPIDYWPLNTALYVNEFHGNYPKFAYYLLKSIDFTRFNSGSAQPSLNRNFIHPIEIKVPPLSEQKAIAHILGSLDDRIELNRRMNETLEAMAQALFKSWFVDFDPVIDNAIASGKEVPEEIAGRAAARAALGDKRKPLPAEIRALFPDEFVYSDEMGWVPKGWEITKIGDELETILGGTPARKNKEFWNNGSIPWINSGKVNEFRVIEPSELITEEAVRKSATKLLPKRTTLLAITGATLGQVSLNEIECCANQSVVGILGKEELPNEFVYLWITNNIEGIISSQTGGAQQHINKGNVNEASILLPSQKIMNCFLQIGTSYFDKISLNCFSNKTLATLRDTLLPKLLSGELRIPKGEG
ncbi:Restriction endonuclease subunit S [Candidatus Electronema halotolerans]